MAEPDDFLGRLQASLTGGLRLVRLRAPELADGDYRQLAIKCLPLCRAAGAHLLLDRDHGMVVELGADGLHLTSARLMAASSRPLPMPYRVAASCHSAVELSHAQSIGADFAVLSPVRATASHPDARPLGWRGFRDLVRGRALPVFALGGLATGDLAEAWRHGARGVAAIRGLWAEAGSSMASTGE
jgi:8-oxo-dGTP diphosphatase